MAQDKIKVFLACVTCIFWYPFFDFLNSYIRTWRICFNKLDKLESMGKKAFFSCFMCCCGFCCFGKKHFFKAFLQNNLGCLFSCYGVVDVWTKPCDEF